MLPFISRCLRFRPPPKALKPALVSFSCCGRASPGETAAGFANCIATITADLQTNGADFLVSLGHMPGKAFGGLNHQAHPAQIADGSLELWPCHRIRYCANWGVFCTASRDIENAP